MGESRYRPLDGPDAAGVKLGGRIGVMQQRSQQRLWGPEFDEKFLIADLDFNQERWFTNYSGDISGRFLECMALSGKEKAATHRALSYLLKQIPENQREDGHFGIELDFSGPLDSLAEVPRKMPILWGNARMLPALVEAWQTFGEEALLESAKRLGDFYLTVAKDMENPDRIEEYRASGTYAPGYATCYFPGMEGLVLLYQATGEEKYLKQAGRMAIFRNTYGFDALPIEHSHGFLCSVYGLLLLAGEDREGAWLKMAQRDWENLVEGGYVLPSGGLLEKAVHGYALDEGCSQADWLRVNLRLYCLTGKDKYLDMAERVLYNQMRMNQCESGGFGHRRVLYDSRGVAGYGKYYAEALWCCDFHGAAALMNLKRHVILQEKDSEEIRIPLLLDFRASCGAVEVTLEVVGPGDRTDHREWRMKVAVREKDSARVWLRVPEWAKDFQVCGENGAAVAVETRGQWIGWTVEKGTAEYSCRVECPVSMEKRHLGPAAVSVESPRDFCFLLRQGPDLLVARKGEETLPFVAEGMDDGMEAVYVFRAEAVGAEPAEISV